MDVEKGTAWGDGEEIQVAGESWDTFIIHVVQVVCVCTCTCTTYITCTRSSTGTWYMNVCTCIHTRVVCSTGGTHILLHMYMNMNVYVYVSS